MAVAIVLSTSRSGVLALALMILVLAIGTSLRASPRRRILTVAYLVLLVFVAFGWGTTTALTARFDAARGDFQDRVEIWKDAARVVKASPWSGTGLNTYGTAMLFYQTSDLREHYAEAHNDYLQLAAEGGLLLCLPAALLAGAIALSAVRAIRREGFTGARAGAVAGLIAIAFQELGDFSLQMPGNVVLWTVLVALAVAPRVAPRGRNLGPASG